MTEFYKKEDVIEFLNLHCPKDMWEYQIADLNTVKVIEYADKEQAYLTGYGRGKIAGVVRCNDCKHYEPRTDHTGLCGWHKASGYNLGVAVNDYCSMANKDPIMESEE